MEARPDSPGGTGGRESTMPAAVPENRGVEGGGVEGGKESGGKG